MVNKYNAFEAFLADKEERLSKNSIENYTRGACNFFRFCPIEEIENITPKHFKQWVRYMGHEGYSPNTIFTYSHAVILFSSYLMEEGILSYNLGYGTDLPRPEEAKPRVADDHTMFLILEASRGNIRDHAILETLLVTGVRAGELGIMTKENWDDKNNQIFIPALKGPVPRYVFYTEKCGELINRYMATRNDDIPYLFATNKYTHFTRQSVYDLVEKYVELAGIDERISPHWFRRKFATHLLDRGCPEEILAYLLGHADLRHIKRYAKSSDKILKREYDKYI
jgi:integrase/recombinase XerD